MLKRKKLAKAVSLLFCLNVPSRVSFSIGVLSFLTFVVSIPVEARTGAGSLGVLVAIGVLAMWYDISWRPYAEFRWHFPSYAIEYVREPEKKNTLPISAYILRPTKVSPLSSSTLTKKDIRLGYKLWNEGFNRMRKWNHQSIEGFDFDRRHLQIFSSCIRLKDEQTISTCYSLIHGEALKSDDTYLRSYTGNITRRADWVNTIGDMSNLYPVFRIFVTSKGKEHLQFLKWIPMYSNLVNDVSEDGSMKLIASPDSE